MNPYYKYLTPEDREAMAVKQYIDAQYPDVYWWHTPNEGKRTKYEQYKCKVLGIKSGVSDYILTADDGKILFLELKAGKNKPTENQKQFIATMNKFGFSATWACGFDQAKVIIDTWQENRKEL